MVGPAVKREGVAHLRATMGLSERRACSIVSADRKMVRYLMSAARHGASDAIARSRQREEAFRISSAVRPVAAGGRALGRQPHLPALSRRRPHGAQAAGSEARRGVAGADLVESKPTLAGRWISSTTSLPAAGGSAF